MIKASRRAGGKRVRCKPAASLRAFSVQRIKGEGRDMFGRYIFVYKVCFCEVC